jgi:hypothetical protein
MLMTAPWGRESLDQTTATKLSLQKYIHDNNRLPLSIKAHSNDAKSFKTTLKNYLIEHAFYSLVEYYQFQ